MLPVLRRNGWNVPATPWFDRVFDDVDRAFRASLAEQEFAGVMPLSLWSDDDAYHVEVELPGAKLEDVEATVHEGRLHLRFERKPEEGRNYLHNSRQYGRVERVVTLPEPVDADKVQATLIDGILRLTLPKSAQAKPYRISIQQNAQG